MIPDNLMPAAVATAACPPSLIHLIDFKRQPSTIVASMYSGTKLEYVSNTLGTYSYSKSKKALELIRLLTLLMKS